MKAYSHFVALYSHLGEKKNSIFISYKDTALKITVKKKKSRAGTLRFFYIISHFIKNNASLLNKIFQYTHNTIINHILLIIWNPIKHCLKFHIIRSFITSIPFLILKDCNIGKLKIINIHARKKRPDFNYF